MLLGACSGSSGRRVARTSPEKKATPVQVALPAGSADAAPQATQDLTTAAPAADDPEAIIFRAQEAYDMGLEALKSGDSEAAREYFDRAVEIFINSGIPIDQDRNLRRAFDRMVDDIADLESDLAEAPSSSGELPTEELDEITPDLTDEQAKRDRAQVAPEAAAITFDIPMVVNDKVLAWIEIFKNRKEFRQSFIGGYERFGWYEPMIHRIFAEEGMPADLIYMAFLESTYKTSAYSRARAKGIWQFMTPTGRQYGLKVNRYVDERSHPEKSTRAAARYMKDLYATLGDWHLAIAAYNTGAGNIMRAQRRSGKTSYWDLAKTRYMRLETKNFVPAILALALMAKEPAKYGFEGLQHNPPLTYDRVVVDGPIHLSRVADLAGVEEQELRFLNPHLRRGVTPPGDRNHELLVPAGAGPRFTAAYQALPSNERIATLDKIHTVRRGETMASIASRYGTSVRELASANGISNAHRISVGMQLTVPGAAAESEDRVATRTVRRQTRVAQDGPYHVVRRGDTLYAISRAYGVSLNNLLDWNGISRRTVLRPGMRLTVIPSGSPVSQTAEPAQMAEPVQTAGTAPAAPPAATPTAGTAGLLSVPGGGQSAPDPAGEKVTYRVRRGDNLFRIALRFSTTVDNLRAWNNLAGDSIRAGDLLTIYND